MSRLHAEQATSSKLLLQLYDQERCVGTATVIRNYLDDITVYPEFRHRGYGQELLRACEERGVVQAIVVSESGRHLFAAAGWENHGGPRFELHRNQPEKHTTTH